MAPDRHPLGAEEEDNSQWQSIPNAQISIPNWINSDTKTDLDVYYLVYFHSNLMADQKDELPCLHELANHPVMWYKQKLSQYKPTYTKDVSMLKLVHDFPIYS